MREDVQAAAPMTGMARKPAESGRGGHRGLALGLVLLAQLLVVIDVSIVTLALPAIQRAFHFSPVGLASGLINASQQIGGAGPAAEPDRRPIRRRNEDRAGRCDIPEMC